jgi:hypothetical protein
MVPNLVLWHPIFVGVQNGTIFMAPTWHLGFWGGSNIAGKSVHPFYRYITKHKKWSRSYVCLYCFFQHVSCLGMCQSVQAFYAIKLPFSWETTEETHCTTNSKEYWDWTSQLTNQNVIIKFPVSMHISAHFLLLLWVVNLLHMLLLYNKIPLIKLLTFQKSW